MQLIQKVENYECRKCEGKLFTVSLRSTYQDVLPIKGEENPGILHFTCLKCGHTYQLARLVIGGVYDPADKLAKHLRGE